MRATSLPQPDSPLTAIALTWGRHHDDVVIAAEPRDGARRVSRRDEPRVRASRLETISTRPRAFELGLGLAVAARMSSHARSAPLHAYRVPLGVLVLTAASGCHAPVPRDATAQSRLESALTSRPAAAMVASARPRLRIGCTRGDAAACSAYGLVEELGIDTAPATEHARELYARACASRNVRGCAHLGRALLLGIGGAIDHRSAASLLARACRDGDAAACGTLGAAWLDGDVGLPRRVSAGLAMLENACAAGDGVACTRLGDALVSGELGTSSAARAGAAWERGCAAGHADACRRLTATSATETLSL